jgi:hypothetical protein
MGRSMSSKWTAVTRKRHIANYEQRHDIASWLAKHAGTHGLDADWYMVSTSKGSITTYTYRFRDKNVAILFKLTFGSAS